MNHSHKIVKEETHKITWNDALADAKAKLKAAKFRVRQMTEAVRVCEQRVRDGEEFPASETL